MASSSATLLLTAALLAACGGSSGAGPPVPDSGVHGVGFDEIYFMTYRSTYAAMAGFKEPWQLAEDIAAARAGGNYRVFIFNLDGMLSLGNAEEWLALAHTLPAEPPPDEASEQGLSLLSMLDGLF